MHCILKLDAANREVYLSLNATKIQDLLNKQGTEEEEVSEMGRCSWHPEYGAWMVEDTPDAPYGGWTADLRRVEANMRVRRARLLMVLGVDEISPTMGVGQFCMLNGQTDSKCVVNMPQVPTIPTRSSICTCSFGP